MMRPMKKDTKKGYAEINKESQNGRKQSRAEETRGERTNGRTNEINN